MKIFLFLMLITLQAYGEINIPAKCDERAYIFYDGLPFTGYFNYTEMKRVFYNANENIFKSFNYGEFAKNYPTAEKVTNQILNDCKDKNGLLNAIDEQGKNFSVKFDNLIEPNEGFDIKKASFKLSTDEKLITQPKYVFTKGISVKEEQLEQITLMEEDKKIITYEAITRLLEAYSGKDNPYLGIGEILYPTNANAFEIYAYSASGKSSASIIFIRPKYKNFKHENFKIKDGGLTFIYNLKYHFVINRSGFITDPTFLNIDNNKIVLHYHKNGGDCGCDANSIKEIFYKSDDGWYPSSITPTLSIMGM